MACQLAYLISLNWQFYILLYELCDKSYYKDIHESLSVVPTLLMMLFFRTVHISFGRCKEGNQLHMHQQYTFCMHVNPRMNQQLAGRPNELNRYQHQLLIKMNTYYYTIVYFQQPIPSLFNGRFNIYARSIRIRTQW